MKRFFLLAVVCMACICGFSQQVTGTLKGTVVTIQKGDTGFAKLKIYPPQATVYINEYRLSEIPESVKLNTGTYTIYVEAAGYPSQSKTFVIEKDKTCTVEVILNNTEKVSIETNVAASRIIDGIDYPEATNASYDLAWGKHTIECMAEGYIPLKKTIEVKAGRNNAHSFTLKEVPPTPQSDHTIVTIETNVPARRVIDGVEYAVSQKQAYEMTWGGHSLALSADGYLPLNTRMNVVFQGKDHFTYNLTKAQEKKEREKVVSNMKGTHEIGVLLGGMFGLSYKYWITNHLAVQTDLAVGLTYTEDVTYPDTINLYRSTIDIDRSFEGLFDVTLNPNLVCNIAATSNFFIFLGIGVNGGYLSNIEPIEMPFQELYEEGKNRIHMGKVGANAMLGMEYVCRNKPLSVSFDFRPGYGLAISESIYGHSGYWEEPKFHYFDWKLGLSIRYLIK